MKHYKPGQYASINGQIYRAKKRIDGCKGCVLNDMILCPMIANKKKTVNCHVDDIIFIL